MENDISWDDVWSFIFGVGFGILVGGLLVAFGMELSNEKFCPTCGSMYEKDAVYCEHDGTLLKERGG